MHSGEKSNKCNQCDYASSHAGHLKTHLKTHSGEKPNKCNQCDFASSMASNLRKHLKTHSGEKSNKCNQCDYASSQAGSLRRHFKIHSRERSNKCNQCDYASSEACNLRTHSKTHSGEKPNTCNQCDYASSRADVLRKHLKTHSGEKFNKCNQCGYASYHAKNLRKHLKKHSTEQMYVSSANAPTTCTKQSFEQQAVFWKATNTDGSDYQFKTEFPVPVVTGDIEGSQETAIDIKLEPLVFVAVTDDKLQDSNEDERSQPSTFLPPDAKILKCNHCNYATPHAGHLGEHLKIVCCQSFMSGTNLHFDIGNF